MKHKKLIFSFVFFKAIATPLAIVVIRNELVSNETEKELYAVIILLVVHFLGALTVAILGIYFVYSGLECVNCKEARFLKIKLISAYMFGTCYSLYCGLYIWKQIDKGSRGEFADLLQNVIQGVGIASYVTTLIHIFILIIVLSVFHKRHYTFTIREKLFFIFSIYFTYIGISIDALSSEFLYTTHTNSTLLPQNETRAVEVMKKLEPLISFTIIGFSLMTIDLLFTKCGNTLSFFDLQTNTLCPKVSVDLKIKLGKSIIQHIFIMTSFGIFAFSITEILCSDQFADLDAYIITQIVIKSINLLLVLIIFSIFICLLCKKCENANSNCKCSYTISTLNVSFVIMIVTCIYHTSYYLVCSVCNDCVAIASKEIYVLVENIITMLLAVFQTLFILGTYSCRKCEKCVSTLCTKITKFVCSVIGIINLGLWVSNIIGKERLVSKPENSNVWEIYKTFSLLLSNFFQFQTGLEFIKMFWHNTKTKTTEKGQKPKNAKMHDN